MNRTSHHISGLEATKQEKKYDLTFSPKDLPRLSQSGITAVGDISANFRFYKDAGYKPYVELSIKGEFTQDCQRCFSDVSKTLDTSTTYVLLVSESQDEQNFAPNVEPVILEEGEWFNAAEVLTDEILLSLPVYPLHAMDDCEVDITPYLNQGEEELIDQPEHTENNTEILEELSDGRPNPFAVLASLKTTDKKTDE